MVKITSEVPVLLQCSHDAFNFFHTQSWLGANDPLGRPNDMGKSNNTC